MVAKSFRGLMAGVLSMAFFLLPLTAWAADYGGGAIQSYGADRPLDSGTIVELTERGSGRVRPAVKERLSGMLGVTVDPQTLPVRLSSEALDNESHVAASGTYNVLVSTENGAIAQGDYVTLSSISGIGMKADVEQLKVLGRAGVGFDGQGSVVGETILKDVNGKSNKSIKIGSIPVTIEIQNNPNEKSTKAKVPEMLERIGQAIAEKEVSPIRIYLSLAITAVSLIAAIAVIYSGVKNSIISIGRNPMSKKSIFRALLEIILTSVLILIIGLFAVYLLLKL